MTAVKKQASRKPSKKEADYDTLLKLSKSAVNAWNNTLYGKIELEKAMVPLRAFLEKLK